MELQVREKLTHNTSQAECEEIVREAEKHGLEISGVASGESWTTSPTANDEDLRKKIIDFTRENIADNSLARK
ncbi:MAG: hypothetical protein CM1200mP30_21360 [Pseudomonadota bacterium]|nr:MAG: hypothetical protein CM1200mP30_21360 [Pseudomonadota bacterium]